MKELRMCLYRFDTSTTSGIFSRFLPVRTNIKIFSLEIYFTSENLSGYEINSTSESSTIFNRPGI